MSTNPGSPAEMPAADDDQEREIAEYLLQHPDFLRRHPEVLAALEVPHATGGASLIEHQVSVLRDRNTRLSRRLDGYHEVAEDNAQRLERIHELYRLMLDADDPADLVARVRSGLCQRFGCTAAAVALFRAEVPEGAVSLDGESAAPAFEGLRQRPEAAVGRLARARLQVLFGEAAGSLRSAALAPLDESGELGLLVLASDDEDRYHPGMGTLFLELLARMLGESLQRLETRETQ